MGRRKLHKKTLNITLRLSDPAAIRIYEMLKGQGYRKFGQLLTDAMRGLTRRPEYAHFRQASLLEEFDRLRSTDTFTRFVKARNEYQELTGEDPQITLETMKDAQKRAKNRSAQRKIRQKNQQGGKRWDVD